MIDIEFRIEKKLKEEIIIKYEEAVKECSQDEVEYITKKFTKVSSRLANSSNRMEKALASFSIAMYRVLISEATNKPEPYHRKIIAALFYLCNPYDVIPDFDPERGYVDDSIVINCCLKQLKKDAPMTYKSIIKMACR